MLLGQIVLVDDFCVRRMLKEYFSYPAFAIRFLSLSIRVLKMLSSLDAILFEIPLRCRIVVEEPISGTVAHAA